MNKELELKKLDKQQLINISISSTGGFFNKNISRKKVLDYLIRNIDKVKDEDIKEEMTSSIENDIDDKVKNNDPLTTDEIFNYMGRVKTKSTKINIRDYITEL